MGQIVADHLGELAEHLLIAEEKVANGTGRQVPFVMVQTVPKLVPQGTSQA
jgi:hypothetical protein